jgi:uncharacterized protein YbjQ (UPF0145 family)
MMCQATRSKRFTAKFSDLLSEAGIFSATLGSDSREQAITRLREAAVAKGGNAVLAMRFDSSDIGGIMNEVAAYGTAVKISPIK